MPRFVGISTTISWSKCRPLKSALIGTNPGIRPSCQGLAFAPEPNPEPRVALALDVMADGKYLGQIAEVIADVRMVT
jgi:hypothetical protein